MLKNKNNVANNINYLNNIFTHACLFLIAISLIFVAGFRPIGFDRDSFNYLDSFNSFNGFSELSNSNYLDKEPTFWLISWLTNFISGNDARLLFVIYAALGIIIILFSVLKIANHPFVAIFCYIFLLFPLHGMTQIRAGVACAIFLSSIPDVVEKKPKSFFIKSALAVMFHYSAIVIFFVYLLKPKIINIKFYALLPLIGLCLAFFRNQFVAALGSAALFFPGFIEYKILMYIELLQDDIGGDINLFSIYYSSLLVFYYYIIFNIKKFEGKYDRMLIKLLGWTLFVYYAASFLPVIAVRVSELYGAVIIFIIPMLIHSFKEKLLPLGVASSFLLVVFFNNIFVHSLFNF